MAKKTRTRKPSTKKPVAKKKSSPAKKRDGADSRLNGWITHTEFASTDPNAMKKWCSTVLGWKFRPSFPMPEGGEYLLFAYSDKGGGGIRLGKQGEGTVPYVQVTNVKASFDKAIRAGADEIMAPERIMHDLVIAVVRAPGGATIGFAGPK
jgi:predicted enzyme related to lactoylglutathione lyase